MTEEAEMACFAEMAGDATLCLKREDVALLAVLLPAFITSELRCIPVGFLFFLPFLGNRSQYFSALRSSCLG